MATPASSPAARLDAETVRGLVAEVVRRLRAEMTRPPTAAPTAAPATAPVPPPAAGVTLSGRVLSLSMLEKLTLGTTRVTVEMAAVITPSAREYARDKGIVIERAVAGPLAAGIPFLVARAECGGEVAAHAAAVARAVPGGVQIPGTGLADVVAALALHASRDGARGILLTGRPAMATVLANRSASLRAVTARDAATLAAAAADTAANLLVVDPATFPAAMLLRLAMDLATRPFPEVPVALAGRPAGCGCKGH